MPCAYTAAFWPKMVCVCVCVREQGFTECELTPFALPPQICWLGLEYIWNKGSNRIRSMDSWWLMQEPGGPWDYQQTTWPIAAALLRPQGGSM